MRPSVCSEAEDVNAMAIASSKKLQADRVQNAAPGEPAELWVYSSYVKDNWVPRKPGDLTHAEHPGSAIRMGDNLYGIVLAEGTAEPGYAVRYGLKKWEPHHAVRLVIPYTPETQAESAAAYLEEAGKQKLRLRILWLFPLAGLAPDPLQREWESKSALNMALVSAASAIVMIVFCMSMVPFLGGLRFDSPLSLFIDFMAFESVLRLPMIVFTGKPRGTVLLTAPYMLWEVITQPEKRRARRELQLKFAYEKDEVSRRHATGHLVVRSMLFDDWLAGSRPILFEGAAYKPLHWHEEGKGLRRRFVYEFEKIEPACAEAPAGRPAGPGQPEPKGRWMEYTQPRKPERQLAVEEFTRRRDRAQVLALLWGTYPVRVQLLLEAKYHFAAAKWTKITAYLLFCTALLEIWAVFLFHLSVFQLPGPVYFIFESLYRIYKSKVHGLPAASLAGYLIGLFLRPPQ